jgi:hypothetical protein
VTLRRLEKWAILDLLCVDELMVPRIPVVVLQGDRDVEGSPSSKRATLIRRDDDRDSICDGIRVDAI